MNVLRATEPTAYELKKAGMSWVRWFTFDPTGPGFRHLDGRHPPVPMEMLTEGDVEISDRVALPKAIRDLRETERTEEVGRRVL